MTASTLQRPTRVEPRRIRPQPGPQWDFCSSPADVLIYGGQAGGGKLLRVDEPIPTPRGWTTMGEVLPGDEVFDADGNVTRVAWVSEIEPKPEAYELVFSDGTAMQCDAGHQWVTLSYAERDAQLRLDDDWRARRRASRPSRATGCRSALFTAAVSVRNSRLAASRREPPPKRGTTKTTREIAETLLHRGRANHCVVNAGPLQLPPADLPIDPYVLGAWLGDGHTNSGAITGLDEEVFESVAAVGYGVTPLPSCQRTRRVRGLTTQLRALGVLWNKHIPQTYLRASFDQRVALLQGLCDTDGTADRRKGCVVFTTTNAALRDGMSELLAGLGIKSRPAEGRAKLNGRDISAVWDFIFWTEIPCFRIERKATRQKVEGLGARRNRRYIVDARRVESFPMRCIAVDSPSHTYLAGRQMVPTHNSYGQLLDAARHVGNPRYRSVIFRRTTKQLTKPGALWDQAVEMYVPMGARAREGHSLDFTFPSGAQIVLSHMEHEKNRFDWHGAQAADWRFDELQDFTSAQFWYVALSRGRSDSGINPTVRGTCNPDPDCFVAPLIAWWWNPETGYPISERSGVIRWFHRIDEQVIWYDTPEDARAEDVAEFGPPISFTFISASLADNPILEKSNPTYRSRLNALSYVERERLLKGNWLVRPTAGRIFKRSWWVDPTAAPPVRRIITRAEFEAIRRECEEVRYWDKAGTADEGSAYAARTAGVRMARHDKTGRTYVVHAIADYLEDIEREKTIRDIAEIDGPDVEVCHEQEPGSGGKDSARATTRNLMGFDVHAEKVTGSKVARWRPYGAQAEAGNVWLVEGEWNEDFMAEHQAADGTKRVRCDQVDAAAGAFNRLARRSGRVFSIKG